MDMTFIEMYTPLNYNHAFSMDLGWIIIAICAPLNYDHAYGTIDTVTPDPARE